MKQGSLYRSVIGVAAATGLLLLIPFVAMQFTQEVNWSASDFVIMGALLFGTGLSYVLVTRSSSHLAFRIAMAMAVGTTFLMIWANLAVGLIGSGANAGNLLFMAVVFVAVIGTLRSRFTAAGMERAMYATAVSLVVLSVVALSTGMQRYPGSSVIEILGVSGFFTGLYLVAASLFRYTAREVTSSF